MLQFNGKQEDADATHARSDRAASAEASNLRCPRNGKRTNDVDQHQRKLVMCLHLLLSSQATERLEQAHGKAMRVAPRARIPANIVERCAVSKRYTASYRSCTGGEAGESSLLLK